ncbi:MAG: hypothetical protein Kow0098_19230 [Ignavibacteriaceae bacterium]
MKTILVSLTLLFISIKPQAQDFQAGSHSSANLDCRLCHVCEVPTREDPCLVECPRGDVTVTSTPEEGPDVVVMNELEGEYGPVSFTHRVHAEMSGMSGGCRSCHHYNTLGPILNCNQCHSVNRKRDNIDLPDLKGAYHRQCMNCHREWNHSTDCYSCHNLGKSDEQTTIKKKTGKKHPEIIEPVKVVYNTSDSDEGKLVVFYHDEHTNLFGLDCVSCHQKENCNRCHDISPEDRSGKTKIPDLSIEEIHKDCFPCHEDDRCTKCHKNSEPGRFNHFASSGWALKDYHLKLQCSSCHTKKNVFTGLSNDCTSCHRDWSAENFEHSVTGLILDETHSEFGCDFCHTDLKFNLKPDCNNCHEGYDYPDKLPGKRK